MENNNNLADANKLDGVFPLCFFIGLLGFLITWQSDADYSGVRGFFIGFFVPYILYILISLLARKEQKTNKKTIQLNTDELTIKETIKGENVEINIVIPKSLLNLKNNV